VSDFDLGHLLAQWQPYRSRDRDEHLQVSGLGLSPPAV